MKEHLNGIIEKISVMLGVEYSDIICDGTLNENRILNLYSVVGYLFDSGVSKKDMVKLINHRIRFESDHPFSLLEIVKGFELYTCSYLLRYAQAVRESFYSPKVVKLELGIDDAKYLGRVLCNSKIENDTMNLIMKKLYDAIAKEV